LDGRTLTAEVGRRSISEFGDMTVGRVLHVVFNRSAAGSLKQALDLAGRDERVIGLCDDFSFGPISSDGPDVRAQWVEDVLGYTGWDEVIGESAAFLAESRSADRLRAWVSMREASTYARLPLVAVEHGEPRVRRNDRRRTLR
jgi:hypothetical protein